MTSHRSEPPGLARFALLALLGTAGYWAWLSLLDPDPWRLGFGGLDHLTGGAGRKALTVLAVATLSLLLLRSRYWGCWRAAAASIGSGRAWAAIAVIHLLTATAVTGRVTLYPIHLALTLWCTSIGFLSLTAAAWECPQKLRQDLWVRFTKERRFRWYAALLGASAAATLSVVVFDRIPHIPDEVVYLFQAKYFAEGLLYLPAPGVPAAFDVIHTVQHDGRFYGIFPPGWPMILALGVKAAAVWLVNPLLTGALILATHRFIRLLYDAPTANLAALLLATSPWLLFLGASLMAHTATLLCGVFALDATARLAQRPSFSPAAIGGTALGCLVLIRPFDGVLIGVVAAGWLLAVSGVRAFSLPNVVFGLVAVAIGGLTLPYNRALTGNPFYTPIGLYFEQTHYPGVNRLGFGSDVGNVGWGNDVLPGHSVLEAAINTNFNTHLTQIELFGWPLGALLLAIIFLLHPNWWLRRGAEVLLLAVVAMVIGGYALYWYHGADLGPRYWSLIIVPLATISALAAQRLSAPDARLDWRIVAITASLAGLPAAVAYGVTHYRDYRGMTTEMRRLSLAEGFGHDIVMIRGSRFSDYSSGFILNPPTLQGKGPLFVRAVEGTALDSLRAAFPDRRTWIIEGASLTGAGPRVVAGPLRPWREAAPTGPPPSEDEQRP